MQTKMSHNYNTTYINTPSTRAKAVKTISTTM